MKHAEQELALGVIAQAVQDGDWEWLASDAGRAWCLAVGLSDFDTLAMQCGVCWGMVDRRRFFGPALDGLRYGHARPEDIVMWQTWQPVNRGDARA